MGFIAHTKNENGSILVQNLHEHLESTAYIAGGLAAHFCSRECGEIIGLWHDIGKIQPNFQQFISQEAGIIPYKRNYSTIERAHAKIGAVALCQLMPLQYARLLSYCIEGHHKGIANWFGELEDKVADGVCWDAISAQNFLRAPVITSFPKFTHRYQPHQWVRMMFSVLVDSDRLDTERFVNPEQSAFRGQYDTLDTLKGRLDNYLKKFETSPCTALNEQRALILTQCRNKGSLAPGVFSLTVPTGAGKTLSSIAWALNHAIAHGKRRILVAIPYTSIITQNASIFREIFGSNNVLEHHSNLSEEIHTEINENNSLRLSMENWDVPIVVTTNVQLFESLHSNSPSVCRKIHNITNSVLIIDEAQMLPVEFLKPILQSIEGLATLFRTSILFTTATQPVFAGKLGAPRSCFRAIELPIKEIVENSDSLYLQFKRTTLHLCPFQQDITFQALARELSAHRQVLCIVNTRAQAQKLCREMPEGTIHLSRNMYSLHLMEQISLVKARLSQGCEVRVVSTQLIEAGVDIDFPIVYRAMSGLDSIIQAAGRCNREGKRANGDVYIFKLEGERLRGVMAQGEAVIRDLLCDKSLDELTTPAMLKLYFKKLYGRIEQMDKPKTDELLIQDAGQFKMQFATYATNFQLIDEKGSERLLIPIEGGSLLYEKMRAGIKLSLLAYREIQQYSVSVSKYVVAELKKNGSVDESFDVKVLDPVFYDSRYGVVVDGRWIDELIYI